MSKKRIKYGQLALCYCPGWNELGYQVAVWQGNKFDYAEAGNDDFDKHVKAFLPMNENGKPIEKPYINYR